MTAPTEWRTLPVTEFPALVQWDNENCSIIYATPITFAKPLRWQPWVNPPLPKPDAFEEWLKGPGYYWTHLRQCWDASEKHAQKRFSEGVDRLIRKFSEQGVGTLVADLRALARGEEASK